MFLSKRSNGIYYLWYEDELGKPQKTSTRCRRKADALQFVKEFESNQAERKVKLQRISLSLFKEDFLAYSSGVHTIKTQKHFAVAFREFLRVIGDLPLHRISSREIEEFLSIKKAEASSWTSRKYRTALASAFEKAREWNLIVENPFRKTLSPKVPEVTPVFLTQTQFQLILNLTQDQNLKDVLVAAVTTGMRLGELLAMRWEDVNLVNKTILVRCTEEFLTKNRKNRQIPINISLGFILNRRREDCEGGRVFKSKYRRFDAEIVSKSFKQLVRTAGLDERVHFHSLRHTFASWLVQDGASLYEVQKLLGHSSAAVTQIYSHLQPETLHATVNRISLNLN